MNLFTADHKIRHWDEADKRLIALEKGDAVNLRDELVAFFCANGWGTAPGVETNAPVPGVRALHSGEAEVLNATDTLQK